MEDKIANRFLSSEQLDDLLRANEEWLDQQSSPSELVVDEFVDLHDSALKPVLRRTINSVSPRMINNQDFFAQLQKCFDKFKDMFVKFIDEYATTPVMYLYLGEKIAKSNMWCALLFWKFLRQQRDFPKLVWRGISQPQLLALERKPNMSAALVIVDDCAYSGRQLANTMVRNQGNIIICPYLSPMAFTRIYEKIRLHYYVHLFNSDKVVPTTQTLEDFFIYEEGKPRPLPTTLARMIGLERYKDNDLVTMVFQHKIANIQSIPICFFNSTKTVQLQGTFTFVNTKNPADRIQVTIREKPDFEIFPIISPCRMSDSCQSCYLPYYEMRKFRLSKPAEAACQQVFPMHANFERRTIAYGAE